MKKKRKDTSITANLKEIELQLQEARREVGKAWRLITEAQLLLKRS